MQQLNTLLAFCQNNPPNVQTLAASVETAKRGFEILQMYNDINGRRAKQTAPLSSELQRVVVPRIVWMYWETLPGRTKPAYLEACMETIRRACNGTNDINRIEIRVIDPSNVAQYVSAESGELHPAWRRIGKVEQRADYLRVLLLAKFGGVWLDADTICFGSLVPFLQRMEREQRDLVLWQRDWSFEMNNALIVCSARHPVMVDALQRMHTRFDQCSLRGGDDEPIVFDNWTELGSVLYAGCVHQYLYQQLQISVVQTQSPLMEIRNMSEIEPFGWLDVHEWLCDRTHTPETERARWLNKHMHDKRAHPDTLIPVLSFPNALIPTDYRKRSVSFDALFRHEKLHYLSLALQHAML